VQDEPITPNISHTVYNPLNSTTAEPAGQVFEITYGTGVASGIVFLDTVTVGGIQVQAQNVEAAIVTDQVFLNPANSFCDGIFGLWNLGNTTVSPGGNAMVLQDLMFGDASPEQKVFTALLTRPNENNGFYTFGSIDQDALSNQSINFVDVIPSGNLTGPFWTVPAFEFFVNGQLLPNPGEFAIIDTGTTLVLVEDEILPPIYEPLGGFFDNTTGLWLFPANFSQADIPEVILPVGKYNLTIDPADIVFDTVDIPGFVIGGIQSNDGIGITILGDVWLRNAYAIFDLGTGSGLDSRFGFVPRLPGAVVGQSGNNSSS
jgi:aspergillopepsin I